MSPNSVPIEKAADHIDQRLLVSGGGFEPSASGL
jgi:hypothetical protein